MVVREGRLFAAIGPGLVILDITDPAEPVKLSETYMGGRSVRSVAVDGDLAFVRAQDTLAIFDVRDAAHPVFFGGTAITCQYGGIAEARDHVFAGCNEQLAAIDVSNPSQPTLTSEIPVPELGLKARIVPRDTLLYLAASRFEVLSTANPASPELIGILRYPDIDCALDLVIDGNLAFVANHSCTYPPVHSKLTIVNISDATAPSTVASHTIMGGIERVAKLGSVVFCSMGLSGVVGIDVHDPNTSQLISHYSTPGLAGPICVDENVLLVADEHVQLSYSIGSCSLDCKELTTAPSAHDLLAGGIHILDATNPSSVVRQSTWQTGSSHLYMASTDCVAVTSEASGRLTIIDISDSTTLTEVGYFTLAEAAGRPCIQEDVLCVPTGSRGLVLLDISDPSSPILIGEIDTPGGAGVVDVEGNYAYVGDSYSGVQIIDITDPREPSVISSIATGGLVTDIEVDREYAFVSDYQRGFLVADVSDPTNPAIIGSIKGPGTRGLELRDTLVFTNRLGGVFVMNVANPRHPVEVFRRAFPLEIRDIAIKGDSLYAASGLSACVTVFDVTNPQDIRAVDSLPIAGQALAVSSTGQYVVVAGTEGVFRFSRPHKSYEPEHAPLSPFILHQNSPNPFNSRTTIRFLMHETGNATLEVFNILGQRVCRIFDGVVSAGMTEVEWESADHASGVYFYRLTSRNYSEVKKMLLLK